MTCYRKSGSTLDRTMKAYLWIALINSGLHNEIDQEGKRPMKETKRYIKIILFLSEKTLVWDKWAILGKHFTCCHNSLSALRIFLNFCTTISTHFNPVLQLCRNQSFDLHRKSSDCFQQKIKTGLGRINGFSKNIFFLGKWAALGPKMTHPHILDLRIF